MEEKTPEPDGAGFPPRRERPLALDGIFLIRRAHQVATARFQESCPDTMMTPTQYAVLAELSRCEAVGQNELGRRIHLDRATTSLVVRLLRRRGLISVATDDGDRRRTILALTNAGRAQLDRISPSVRLANDTLLSAFDPPQAQQLCQLLGLLTVGSRNGAHPITAPTTTTQPGHRG